MKGRKSYKRGVNERGTGWRGRFLEKLRYKDNKTVTSHVETQQVELEGILQKISPTPLEYRLRKRGPGGLSK